VPAVRRAGSWIAASIVLGAAAAAAADDLVDFQHAREAYDAAEYPSAVERLRGMLDRDPPPSRAIREECLQYLGASLLFLGRGQEADVAFERLLVLEPEWEMDDAVFPGPILEEFGRIKELMRERLAAMQAAEQALREMAWQRQVEEDRRRREALAAALEPRYLVREQESRMLLLAFVPFGVGQFQNDQETKGWTFLGIESALFAANAWTFLAWDWYTREWKAAGPGTERADQAASFAEGYKIASWAILGTLLATMAAGIIDALVFYEEVQTTWRLLPPEDVPAEHRPPPRSPDDYLPPLERPAWEMPVAPEVGLSFRWRF